MRGVLVLCLVLAHRPMCRASQEEEEWVACVPEGLKAARSLAIEQDLVLLDEVIPGSRCYHFRQKRQHGRHSKRSAEKGILSSDRVSWAERQVPLERKKRVVEVVDPYWKDMWYLNRPNGPHMNVEEAWKKGATGKGVAVTILDDGIEKDHPDLIRNYDPLASIDINDNDSDPYPRYDFSDSNRHGTRCAGQVAASPNNTYCGIGIAYNAQIGGIRMLDGQVSDAVEARSLSFNPDHIDVYSSSWGPNDDGKTVDGPGKLATRAFLNGITRGRDGRGSIFVWASGNGGRYKDNCNCDGYATSIYTITVSSTSESGNIPWYSEACSSTLATTYSSGTTSERQIVTTDLHKECTKKHTGTSASAPMAAAIVALTLEANPELTWRDVQHIIVRTAKPQDLKAADWAENAMGRIVSHSYGYGLMDAGAMVELARRWHLVPKQQECVASSPYYKKFVPAMGYVTVELDVRDCPNIRHLEHVVVPIEVSGGRKRGDLRIYLQSPSGTRSTLLDTRPQDYSSSGFDNWPFMSVHHWGENPTGTWILEVHNDAYSKWASEQRFSRWSLHLYGIHVDYNKEEDDSTSSHRLNVMREAVIKTSTPSTTTTTTTTTTTSTPEVLDRGCASKQRTCTKVVSHCRTFNYRQVAEIFCRCMDICLEVAAVTMDQSGEQIFNLQCDMGKKNNSDTAKKEISGPIYCNFFIF